MLIQKLKSLLLIATMLIGFNACQNSAGPQDFKYPQVGNIVIKIGQDVKLAGVLGGYKDIDIITLDITDATGKYFAKSQPFFRASSGEWAIVLNNIPLSTKLTFKAKAYDKNNQKIYDGFIDQTITQQSSHIYLNLFPISDGNPDSIPQLESVVLKSNSVVLNIVDKSGSTANYNILYRVSKDPAHYGFTYSQGMVVLDKNGKGTIELTYTKFQVGNFIHSIELNNQKGGVLNTTFATKQTSDSNITIAIAPTIRGFNFNRDNTNKTILKVSANVADDQNASTLSYKWDFMPSVSSANVVLVNSTSEFLVIENFDDSVSGVLSLKVVDDTNLTATYNATIYVNQFGVKLAFNVIQTNIINNEILDNESIRIVFSKQINASTVNASSLFVSDGIRVVAGNMQTINDMIVFTPNNNMWNTSKTYVLNIKPDIKDVNAQALNGASIIDFEAVPPLSSSNGVALRAFNNHTDSVLALAMSKDGRYLFSGSKDNTIKMWDIATGMLINKTFANHTNDVNALAMSSDGSKILSSSQDASASLSDSTTGVIEQTFLHQYGVYSATFIDPTHIATGSDRAIRIWDINGTSLQNITTTSKVNALKTTNDGKYIVAGDVSGSIKLYNSIDGTLAMTLSGHTKSINALALTKDGKYIVSASSDNSIKKWDIATGSLNATVGVHSDNVNDILITPNQKYIVSASSDNTIKLWDISTNALLKSYTGQLDIQSLAISPNGKYIYSGSSNGTINEWDLYR